MAYEGAEGENLGNVVAESVGCVGAGGVTFIDLGCAGSPRDLFEVADEFDAARVNEGVGFAEGVLQARIEAIYAVADGWIARIGVN